MRSIRKATPGVPAPDPPGSSQATGQVAFRRFLLYFLGLGTLGFGGPIATVGYMQRDLVEDRKWLDKQICSTASPWARPCPGLWPRRWRCGWATCAAERSERWPPRRRS